MQMHGREERSPGQDRPQKKGRLKGWLTPPGGPPPAHPPRAHQGGHKGSQATQGGRREQCEAGKNETKGDDRGRLKGRWEQATQGGDGKNETKGDSRGRMRPRVRRKETQGGDGNRRLKGAMGTGDSMGRWEQATQWGDGNKRLNGVMGTMRRPVL